MNVLAISRTSNSVPIGAETPKRGPDHDLSFLLGDRRTYALNLIRDWRQQLEHINGLQKKSIKKTVDEALHLITFAQVPPWELNKEHITAFLDERCKLTAADALSPATVAGYCSAWRSLQNFVMEPDRANEILQAFQVRPRVFINEENGVAAKRYKAGWKPKGWALTPAQIDAIDETFIFKIKQAHAAKSKALLPLIRDRVMFHVCVHFALRVSELATVQMSAFKPSHEAAMQRFGNLGTLTVTGKNQVTGTIPMREQQVHDLLRWYIDNIRQKMILRRNGGTIDEAATCEFDGKTFLTSNLLFVSERGGVVSPQTFRDRLSQIAVESGVIAQKLTPHTLRHTGCTLMVPLYTPEVAQKYMRHKNLHTTLYYYHPGTVQAGNEVNGAIALFDDDEDEDD